MLSALLTGSSKNQRKAAEIYPFLEAYIARKEQQIAEIEQVIERYEKKRLMEERAYQSMSPLRRMFAGKKPDHHRAVEYIHYVKKPMEQIRRLRMEIENAKVILNQSVPEEMITLPDEMEKSIKDV
jgi:Ser/Thr protein kinase RdoA (MazF antagonist)